MKHRNSSSPRYSWPLHQSEANSQKYLYGYVLKVTCNWKLTNFHIKKVAKAYFDNVALSNSELALTCVAAVLLLLF